MCAQTTTISPLSLHDALPIFRHYERLLARLEERVIQGEGQRAQERGRREDLHELPGLAAEREANAPPRGAAHAIAPGADHGDRDERKDEERREGLARDRDGLVA